MKGGGEKGRWRIGWSKGGGKRRQGDGVIEGERELGRWEMKGWVKREEGIEEMGRGGG